ncbi:MAG: imidazoleglycerol-phosphate dehydratase HisB [Epsilonproteobacteria bacterium]|nr:imidazoleglycerol-phosphate dehydratase HisB [Campylobacterota bacterium]
MAYIKRETKETKIEVNLELYGKGESSIKSGVGFFDHMLEAFSKHSLIDLDVKCSGDLEVDAHHSVEDIGIVIAKALNKEIYPLKGVERFGNATVVMDEASVTCDIDLSNRAYLVYDIEIDGSINNFDLELIEEFFKSIAFNTPMTLHIVLNRGKNRHHIAEAAFKAFGVALRRALAINERISIPSTKGIL